MESATWKFKKVKVDSFYNENIFPFIEQIHFLFVHFQRFLLINNFDEDEKY